MVTEAPPLFPEVRQQSGPPERGLHGYWRKDNGWIITGNIGTPANRSHFELKGFTALPQYGTFKPGSGDSQAAPNETDVNGAPWNPALEPWRMIFQKGGAKEFPVAQIIAFQWHIRPPYREVTFPQLAGVDVYDIPCPECTRIFSSTNERESALMLRGHLTTKVDPKHSYTVSDLKKLGEEWEIDFESARTKFVKPQARVDEAQSLTAPPAAPVLTPAEAQLNEEYRCDICGEWAPPASNKAPQLLLAGHKRSAHG